MIVSNLEIVLINSIYYMLRNEDFKIIKSQINLYRFTVTHKFQPSFLFYLMIIIFTPYTILFEVLLKRFK